jgi:NAD(P)-dependent dehydrogenase (short-subunit alcohol dehydrogenase family)
MNSELARKVAIVTGGASGIGRAGVAALLGAGATVAALDRDEVGVNAVVDEGKKSRRQRGRPRHGSGRYEAHSRSGRARPRTIRTNRHSRQLRRRGWQVSDSA